MVSARIFVASMASAFILSACSQDDVQENSSSWEVDSAQPSEESNPSSAHRPPTRPVRIQACSQNFMTGPVWQMIADQEATLRESEWIATLTTSKWSLERERLIEHGGLPSSNQLDYAPYMADLEELFEELDIELLQNQNDETLIVAGEPANILAVVQTSCAIVMMDLTGFHCDCAPDSCRDARWSSCRLEKVALYDRVDANYGHLTSFVRTYAGCRSDILESSEFDLHKLVDLRGVRWDAITVLPWTKSSCITPLDHAPTSSQTYPYR